MPEAGRKLHLLSLWENWGVVYSRPNRQGPNAPAPQIAGNTMKKNAGTLAHGPERLKPTAKRAARMIPTDNANKMSQNTS